MSNYRTGADYEREVADVLRAAGYEVTRAAGSKGPWDLHARKVAARTRTRELWIAVYLQAKSRRPRD